MRRFAALLVVGLVLAYGALCVLLWWAQDALLFPGAVRVPAETRDAEIRATGAAPFALTTEDGVRIRGAEVRRGSDAAYLWFPGNGGGGPGVAAWFAGQVDADVFTIEYRGYASSEGHPSEAGLRLDGLALYDYVRSLGYRDDRIIIHGLSMGGGVAHYVATERSPAAAVFESTFASLEDIAAARMPWLPVRWLLAHPFRSEERARALKMPSLVIHSTLDELIPVDHGRRLSRAQPHATYVEVEGGGHNVWLLDDADTHRRWTSFLGEHR